MAGKTRIYSRGPKHWVWDCDKGCLQNSYPLASHEEALADARRHIARWH